MLPALYWGIQQNEPQPWLLSNDAPAPRRQNARQLPGKRPPGVPPGPPPSQPPGPLPSRPAHRRARAPGSPPRAEPAPPACTRRSRPSTAACCASRRCTRSTTRRAAIPTASPRCSCTAVPAAAPIRRCAQFFDPQRYRIVLFDQRGCGRSRPQRQPGGQHDLGPGGRHREPARAPGHRALAGVRRLVGHRPSPWPTRRRTRSGSPSWCCAASSCCATRRSTGSTRTARPRLFPDAGSSTSRRSPRASAATCPRLLQAADRSGPERARSAAARRGRCGRARRAASPRTRDIIARTAVDDISPLAFARIECHYFVHARVPRQRRPAAGRRGPHPPHPGGDRAGALRRRLPDGTAPGRCTARGRRPSCSIVAGRGALGLRARQPHANSSPRPTPSPASGRRAARRPAAAQAGSAARLACQGV